MFLARTVALSLFFCLAVLVICVVESEALVGGSCNLAGMLSLPSKAITLKCYNLDSTLNIKRIIYCDAGQALTCYYQYVTATSVTKNGTDAVAVFPAADHLQHGYYWQIQYCVSGQSGPNCTQGQSDAGSTGIGNCKESSNPAVTSIAEDGNEYGCVVNP